MSGFRREGDNVRVGITDHAQAELTDVVFVELPKVARMWKQTRRWRGGIGQGRERHLRAPSRNVVEANNALLTNNAALITTDHSAKAGFLRSKSTIPDDLKNLLNAAAYQEQIEG